jgi:hypothetical protein
LFAGGPPPWTAKIHWVIELADGAKQRSTGKINKDFWAQAGHWAGVRPDGETPVEFTGSMAFLGQEGSGPPVMFVAAPWGLVYRSYDAGGTWQQIDSGNAKQRTISLLAVPGIS